MTRELEAFLRCGIQAHGFLRLRCEHSHHEKLAAFDYHAKLEGNLCANSVGFSLHAAVYCAPFERGKLEKLCRHVPCPAFVEEWVQLRPTGDIILKLKTKYSGGSTHLPFSGLEFVKREHVRREITRDFHRQPGLRRRRAQCRRRCQKRARELS